MAIAFTAATTATGLGSTSIAINVPGGTNNNDVMVMMVSSFGASGITTPTGWTLINSDFATALVTATYFRVASSEPANYTVGLTGTPAGTTIWMATYTGVSTAAPINASGLLVTVGSTTTPVAASITTSVANTMLLAVFCSDGLNSWTPPGGMTERADIASGGGGASELSDVAVAASGATGTRTATASVSVFRTGAGLIALAPPVVATTEYWGIIPIA